MKTKQVESNCIAHGHDFFQLSDYTPTPKKPAKLICRKCGKVLSV